MSNRDMVVIGASAGGVEALEKVCAGLPPDLPAAVFVVLHLPARGRSFLSDVLASAGPLMAKEAEDGERIERGRIYVAPPDLHLLLGQDRIQLARGPKEGRQRPCINVSFRSAAMTYAERVIGVVLTGMLDDGTAGLWEIKRRGGLAIVQDPDDALFPSMPVSAAQEVAIDYRVSAQEIGPLLALLTTTGKAEPVKPPSERSAAVRFSGLTCPECRGPLWETSQDAFIEFRCRVGHMYSPKMLLDEHTATEERKLYETLVALHEGAELSEFLAARVQLPDRERLMQEAHRLRQNAEKLRAMVETHLPALTE